MSRTVTEVLARATDSVTVINSINTEGSSSSFWLSADVTQAEITQMIQRNVDHLETILAYDGNDEEPDIVNSPEDKSSYTDAITTGKAYVEANS